MSREWTENQKRAIKARGHQCLISAAAGSGKTAVLTERVKNILCDTENRCSSSEILVVTFTKAAAGEMRERIGKALKAELKKKTDNASFLREQLALLPAADICTIDAFCAKIVRENSHLAGVSADFRVIDDNDHTVLKNESVAEVLDFLYDNEDDSFAALKSFFLSERDGKALERVIIDLYDFSRTYPSSEKWLEEITEYFNPEKELNLTPFAKASYKYFELLLDYYVAILIKMRGLIIEDVNEENDFTDLVRDNIENLKKLLLACREERWDDFITQLKTEPIAKYPKSPSGEYYKPTNAIMGECKKALDEILLKSLPTVNENKEDCEKLYPIVKKLVEAINMFSKKLSEKKAELNLFSFDDILHKAIDLLVLFDEDGNPQKTELAKEISRKYKEILIDEYQDTNEAQNILFEMVSDNKNNFYCVGDVKQSIYRFRHASPALFMKLKDALPLSEEEFNKPAQIILEKNFRSRECVTECVNYIFSKLMTKDIGEIKYNENEYLYYGGTYKDEKKAEAELHVLDYVTLNAEAAIQNEATYIAKYIKNAVETGVLVKGEDEALRPARYDDFCVLLRSPKGKAKVYSDALSELGIPSEFENNKINCEAKEIQLLTALIKAVSNPLMDIPLVSVMLSPLFGFTADEVAEIRLVNKNSDLYTCLLEYAKTNEKAKLFVQKLDFYRSIASAYPIYDFVKLLVDDTALAEIFLSTSNGDERYQAIKSFLNCAETYTADGRYGLSGFIRYLDSVIQNNALTKSNTTSLGGVKIMSIHKSKGLEFPFVILANCSKGVNLQDSYGSLTVSREIGLGIKIRDDEKFTTYGTLSSFAGEKAIKIGSMSEELRILYVALTRAKEHLVLVCSVTSEKAKQRIANSFYIMDENDNSFLHPYEVYNAKSLTEWLCSAMLYHKDADSLREYVNVKTTRIMPSNFSLKVVIEGVSEAAVESVENDIEEQSAPVNDALLSKIKERAEYVYPYDALSTVLAKISASSVENHIASRAFFATKKPSFIEEEVSGKDKGKAVHKFFELCDFNNALADFKGELQNLLNDFKLTELEASLVDESYVSLFFESDVAKRLLASSSVLREYEFTVLRNAGDFYPELPSELKNEQIVIQGKLDCAFFEDDGAVLIDYKTDKIADEAVLVEIYKNQLEVYKTALEECMNCTVKESYLYSFKLNKFIKVG